MINITVIDREGEPHELEAPTDMNLNLMEVCKMYELPVKGTCGGMALCSTCHVYVESSHALPEMQDAEADMLDQAFFVEDNSRLGWVIIFGSDDRIVKFIASAIASMFKTRFRFFYTQGEAFAFLNSVDENLPDLSKYQTTR